MILFTDLDRSLIYSKKFILGNKDEINVEKYNGEEISFMSKTSIDLLNELMKKCIVIPTTTRNLEQYNRIEFKKNNINFNMAIVCNGGCIIKDGKPLKEWDEIIKERIRNCGEFKKVRGEFIKYENVAGITKVGNVQEMFFYLVVDKELFSMDNLQDFRVYLDKLNWDTHVSGRKIYFIPSAIKKEYAVDFMIDYLKANKSFAIGDSTMDVGMLNTADISYIPKGSDISGYKLKAKTIISENEGLQGIEEILRDMLIAAKDIRLFQK